MKCVYLQHKSMKDRYGEIEEMNVCDNLGDHLVGNVYIKFRYETDAEKVLLVFVYLLKSEKKLKH